jgi:excisionase family DNA binding protein
MTPADYMTTAEVAKLLKISLSTVTRMAREGRLPSLKVGRLWRIPAQSPDILLYKQQQKTRKAADADKDAPAKNGLKDFVKLAADLGFIEPLDRAALHGRKP